MSVYTQGDAAQAAALLHSYAQLRNALFQASNFHADPGADLKIVVFHSKEEFDEYRLNSGSCAFYQQTGRGEYIVLQDLEAGHREVSFHEFTHFVAAHSGLTLPLWLNEGMADFYSTFRISGETVVFGAAVTGRLKILRSSPWLPLTNLFDVSTTSSDYSNPQRMALYYSESWVLAHMLIAGPGYAEKFPAFLRALGQGRTAAESFLLIYNKTGAQVEQDLHGYVDRQHLPVIEAHIKPAPSIAEQSAVTPISNAEMDITLANLTVRNPDKGASMESRLASAAAQLPDNPAAEEALGYLALKQGKSDEARAHFRLAVDRHSSDANVLFYLAHLDHEAGVSASQVIPLLERSLAIKPDLNDARLELALVATADGNFALALEALGKLTTVRPENAYTAAYTKAYCYAYSDKLTEAKAAAGQAKALAGNDKDKAEVAALFDYIAQESQTMAVSSTNAPSAPR